MTQIVFLLFENGRAPVDSEERYKVEIHFSPGAKGREEIIASGESASCLGLDFKKTIIPLKRMLPDEDSTKMFSKKGSPSSVPTIDPVKLNIKRSAKSLPVLMSQEQLQIVTQMASQNNFFDDEEETVNDQQLLDLSTNTAEDTTTPSIEPSSGNELADVTEEQLGRFCSISISMGKCVFTSTVGMDLATSVKPLQRLCTISLSEMEEFLSDIQLEPRSTIGSRRSSATSHRSSAGSIMK